MPAWPAHLLLILSKHVSNKIESVHQI
jgi:hypothetical protein